MVPVRFREVLRLLHWSSRSLADMLGCDERVIRRWAAGENPVPPSIAAWLEQRAATHTAHPPPDDWRQRAA